MYGLNRTMEIRMREYEARNRTGQDTISQSAQKELTSSQRLQKKALHLSRRIYNYRFLNWRQRFATWLFLGIGIASVPEFFIPAATFFFLHGTVSKDLLLIGLILNPTVLGFNLGIFFVLITRTDITHLERTQEAKRILRGGIDDGLELAEIAEAIAPVRSLWLESLHSRPPETLPQEITGRKRLTAAEDK